MPEVTRLGGWGGVTYYRLHGSPRVYYSNYSEEYLAAMAETLAQGTGESTDYHNQNISPTESVSGIDQVLRTVWCIFDNTALGAATANALDVFNLLQL